MVLRTCKPECEHISQSLQFFCGGLADRFSFDKHKSDGAEPLTCLR